MAYTAYALFSFRIRAAFSLKILKKGEKGVTRAIPWEVSQGRKQKKEPYYPVKGV